MLVTLIVTIATMRGNMIVHTVFGGVFTLLMVVHVWITWRWTKGIAKNFKKVKPKIKWRFIVNKLLSTAWLLCIVTGIIAGVFTLTGIEGLVIRRIHGVSGVLACALTVVHMVQHRQRLMTLLKRKKKVAQVQVAEV